MSLKTYSPVRDAITLPDGTSVDIRGMSLDDISKLILKHEEALNQLFSNFVRDKNKTAKEFGLESLLKGFPLLTADIIAMAADEPEQAIIVLALPFGIQLEALEKVARLTFLGGYTPKKCVELITNQLASLTNNLNTLSKAGSTTSEV